MPLKLAYRGGAVLRTVRLNVLSYPVRVAAIHTPARRTSLVTTGPLPSALVRITYTPVTHFKKLAKSYATAAKKSKTTSKTSKASKASKKSKTAKKSKSTESAKAKAPRGRRKLSETEKKLREAKKKRENLEQLKTTALTPPKKLPENVNALAVQSKVPEARGLGLSGKIAFTKAVELARTIGPEERERFKNIAVSNKAANAEAYDKWVKSHTPLQIKQANLARRRLSALQGKRFARLPDERAVKGIMTPYMCYVRERLASGDLKHMVPQDISSQVSQEWKGMTEAEKERYKRQFAADRDRYEREYVEVYGEEPGFVRDSKAKSA